MESWGASILSLKHNTQFSKEQISNHFLVQGPPRATNVSYSNGSADLS